MEQNIRTYISEITSKGGKSRMARMTPEERRAFAMKGVEKRRQNRLSKASGTEIDTESPTTS